MTSEELDYLVALATAADLFSSCLDRQSTSEDLSKAIEKVVIKICDQAMETMNAQP